VLDVLVSSLQRSRVVPSIGQGEAAAVPQHVRMDMEQQAGANDRALPNWYENER